jgi:hypothetical protein
VKQQVSIRAGLKEVTLFKSEEKATKILFKSLHIVVQPYNGILSSYLKNEFCSYEKI